MPLLRCTECHEEFNESRLAIDSECQHCDAGTLVEVDGWDDEASAEPEPIVTTKTGAGPQLAIARAAARNVLKRNAIASPPVDVETLAVETGFQIVLDASIGNLSGRLLGKRIEIASCGRHRRRFVVAHELGHHFLNKPHESGPHVEQEVNAFAGELLVCGPFLQVALKQTTETSALARVFDVSEMVLEIAASNHQLRGKLT